VPTRAILIGLLFLKINRQWLRGIPSGWLTLLIDKASKLITKEENIFNH